MRPVRALVTGAAGFVGQWLVRALREQGTDVVGLALSTPVDEPRHEGIGALTWIAGDLRDDGYVARVVAQARPEIVVHLAAISHLPTAAADPAMAWETNVTATARLLHHLNQARASTGIDPQILIVGSAEQYGRFDGASRIREDVPQAPRTVYAATKAAQEVLALQAWRADALRVVVARSFNHSGPGQEPRFLLPAMVARALALRAAPAGTPITVGNTTPVRDFLHVSDVVSAYISLLHRGVPGEAYNVASGTGWSVAEVIQRVCARVGIALPLEVDPALVRPVDVPSLIGDPQKLMDTTGWRATRAFDDIIDDLIHAATH